MSIERCEECDRNWDSDFYDECPRSKIHNTIEILKVEEIIDELCCCKGCIKLLKQKIREKSNE